MGDSDIGITVEPDGKLSGSKRLARVPGVANGGNCVNCRPSFEGRGRLSVRLQVRSRVRVGVTGGGGRRARVATVAPRDRFGIGAVRAVMRSPSERLPRGVCRCEVGINVERVGGVAPRGCGVKRRGRVNGRRMGKNTIEREAAVGAVDRFGVGRD